MRLYVGASLLAGRATECADRPVRVAHGRSAAGPCNARPQSEVIIVAMVRRACRGSRTAVERARRKFLKS